MNNNTPFMHGIDIMNVSRKDVSSFIRVYDNFSTVHLVIGRSQVILYTENAEESIAIAKILSKTTLEMHSEDEVFAGSTN